MIQVMSLAVGSVLVTSTRLRIHILIFTITVFSPADQLKATAHRIKKETQYSNTHLFSSLY